MTWEYPPTPRNGPRLRAPEDGIVASLRPKGWLAQRWHSNLDALGPTHQTRLAQGRSFARSGRVRALWFTPGLVTAEVVGSDVYNVALRVRVFEPSEWLRVLDVLLGNLQFIASMMEGELPRAFIDALRLEGLCLVPTFNELGGDCDCADYLLPCSHMSAVHHLLADALDGDPFLLLTLRGWTRDHLMSRLRAAWGDAAPLTSVVVRVEEPPPAGDWLRAPGDICDMRFNFRPPERQAIGLRALGPPPGETDLVRILGPLYESGSEAAVQLALGEDEEDDPARQTRAGFRTTSRPPRTPDATNTPVRSLPSDVSPLSEVLVKLLSELESARSKELAERLDIDREEIRIELLSLEKLGIVYRTGKTRGTRWWLC